MADLGTVNFGYHQPITVSVWMEELQTTAAVTATAEAAAAAAPVQEVDSGRRSVTAGDRRMEVGDSMAGPWQHFRSRFFNFRSRVFLVLIWTIHLLVIKRPGFVVSLVVSSIVPLASAYVCVCVYIYIRVYKNTLDYT
ncbi:hypothetical protein Dimus_038801 [Dionaea muscipula]